MLMAKGITLVVDQSGIQNTASIDLVSQVIQCNAEPINTREERAEQRNDHDREYAHQNPDTRTKQKSDTVYRTTRSTKMFAT